MEMKYNVTGSDRKRLVTEIAEFMACAATYKGAPTFAYEVGFLTIDKNGTVSFDDRNPQRAGNADSENVEKLIQRLRELGFEAEAEEAVDSLILSYPREDITDAALENLRLLVASKETLIKKALAVMLCRLRRTMRRSASRGLRALRHRRKSTPTHTLQANSSPWRKRRSA